MPDESEVLGLLALMLLQDSRRDARVGRDGELVLLEDQDRALWNRNRIDEGMRVLERAVSLARPGPYVFQAAIAAAHAEERPREEIVALYDRLAEVDPSPVVFLNRAVAVALAGDVEDGLTLIDQLTDLEGYHLFHAARADLLRRLERRSEAAAAYREAIALVGNEAERTYLERRLREVS